MKNHLLPFRSHTLNLLALAAGISIVSAFPLQAASAAPGVAEPDTKQAADVKTAHADQQAIEKPRENSELDSKRAAQICRALHVLDHGIDETEYHFGLGAIPARFLEFVIGQLGAIQFDEKNGNILLGSQIISGACDRSPLNAAIFAPAPRCVGILLDAGAPVNCINRDDTYALDYSSLDMANLAGRHPIDNTIKIDLILKMLIHAGVDIRRQSDPLVALSNTEYDNIIVPAAAQVEREKKEWDDLQLNRKALVHAELSRHAPHFVADLSRIVSQYDAPKFSYLEYAQNALKTPKKTTPQG